MTVTRKIAILTHANDNFAGGNYLLAYLADAWQRAGIAIAVLRGTNHFEPADALILHVNLTVIPDDYLAFCERYSVVINGGVHDTSKRRVSMNLVCTRDSYDGAVIVKTDRNFGGYPELHLANLTPVQRLIRKLQWRLPWSWTGYLCPDAYPIFPACKDVPRSVWHNPRLVVEKYRPECEGNFYCLRHWVFFGACEINLRAFSRHPIVKADNVEHREYGLPVPAHLRALRRKLGFDYGKFDYAMIDGEVVLYDANRTPTFNSKNPSPQQRYIVTEIAKGIQTFIPNSVPTW